MRAVSGAGGGRALPSSDVGLALLAGAGNAGGLIGFYKAAELGPLSVVAPIGASGVVIPVAWGLASGDSLRPAQAVGLVLAMGGAVLVARRGSAHHSTAHYPDPRAAALWAAASAMAFGIFLDGAAEGLGHGRAWALLDARLALVALLALWAGRELRGIRFVRGSALFAIPGVLLVVGTIMYTTAAAHGQLSLVSVLGSLFPIVTVALGMGLLGERLSRFQSRRGRRGAGGNRPDRAVVPAPACRARKIGRCRKRCSAPRSAGATASTRRSARAGCRPSTAPSTRCWNGRWRSS